MPREGFLFDLQLMGREVAVFTSFLFFFSFFLTASLCVLLLFVRLCAWELFKLSGKVRGESEPPTQHIPRLYHRHNTRTPTHKHTRREKRQLQEKRRADWTHYRLNGLASLLSARPPPSPTSQFPRRLLFSRRDCVSFPPSLFLYSVLLSVFLSLCLAPD